MSSVKQIEGPIVFVSPNPIDIGPSIDVREAYTAITTAINILENEGLWIEYLEKLQGYFEYFLEREVKL